MLYAVPQAKVEPTGSDERSKISLVHHVFFIFYETALAEQMGWLKLVSSNGQHLAMIVNLCKKKQCFHHINWLTRIYFVQDFCSTWLRR